VWSRLHRSEAFEFVVELRTEAAVSLRERLARALGDPALDIAYRLATVVTSTQRASQSR